LNTSISEQILKEKFEDTKEVIRNHKSKDRQYNGRGKGKTD